MDNRKKPKENRKRHIFHKMTARIGKDDAINEKRFVWRFVIFRIVKQ